MQGRIQEFLIGRGGGGGALYTINDTKVSMASDGSVPLARSLKGSGAMPLYPSPSPSPAPKEEIFPIFPSKTPFPAFLRLEKRCKGIL